MTQAWQAEGFHTVTPYLVVKDPDALIRFLEEVFNAQPMERMTREDGSVMHAEMRVGDSPVMISGSTDGALQTGMLYVYVEDTDAVYARALAAGAMSLREPTDEFYGDRSAGVMDSQGNQWWLATKREQLSSEERQRRARER